MPTVFCTRCGHENPEDSRYCASCGVALSHAGHGHAPEGPTEVTSTISISGIESLDSEHLDTGNDDLADTAVRVTVEALSPARRCSWSSAAPTPAAGSCSTRT